MSDTIVVQEIIILSAEVANGADNTFDVALSWATDEGATAYTGNFWLLLTPRSGDPERHFINCGDVRVRSAIVKGVSPDLARQYTASLSTSETSETKCKPVPLTFRTYEGVRVRCDDETVVFDWDPTFSSIREGVINLVFDSGQSYVYGVTNDAQAYTFSIPEAWRFTFGYRMPLPSAWFTMQTCAITMTAYASPISSGPESAPIVLPLQSLELLSVTLGDLTSDSRSVTITHTPSGVTGSYAQLCFYRDGKLVCESEPQGSASGLVSHTLTGRLAHLSETLEAALFVSTADGLSHLRHFDKQNHIPLAAPCLTVVAESGKVTASWTYSGSDYSDFRLALGMTGIQVCGLSHTFTEPAAEIMDSLISVTPKFGLMTGLTSNVATAFKPGYHMIDGVLSYRQHAYAEQGFSIALPGGSFDTPPTADITAGAFGLSAAALTLTVSSDNPLYADYEIFITKLFEQKLTAYGYYALRNLLIRHLSVSEADRLHYLGVSGKWADLLPGMTLRLETAHFMPQPTKGSQNLEGYTGGSVSEYHISLKDGNLEFDSFLARALGQFEYSSQPAAEPNRHGFAGGIDFFHIGLKRPYFALHYPDVVARSELPADLFTTLNTALYAAPDLSKLIETKKNPDPSPIDYMMFRTRSTITLLHTVTVNNTPLLVPVGTTTGGLAMRLGGAALSLIRETADGPCELPVTGDLYLLPGDRLATKQ